MRVILIVSCLLMGAVAVRKTIDDEVGEVVGHDQEEATYNVRTFQDQSDATELAQSIEDAMEKLSTELEANRSAPYSPDMVKKATALVQKHAPKASEVLTETKLQSLLENHGELREGLSGIDSNSDATNMNDYQTMKHLYKRARRVLDTPTAALLETATTGKTPCVLMIEKVQGEDLVDLDKIKDLGDKWSCNKRCLGKCKRKSKFNIDRHEMRILGQDPDAQGLSGNQIGGQCEHDGDCKCLDATQSTGTIQDLQRRFRRRFDVSKVHHTYEDEAECMDQCPVRFDNGGATWRGMCFDEAPPTFYDDDDDD